MHKADQLLSKAPLLQTNLVTLVVAYLILVSDPTPAPNTNQFMAPATVR